MAQITLQKLIPRHAIMLCILKQQTHETLISRRQYKLHFYGVGFTFLLVKYITAKQKENEAPYFPFLKKFRYYYLF